MEHAKMQVIRGYRVGQPPKGWQAGWGTVFDSADAGPLTHDGFYRPIVARGPAEWPIPPGWHAVHPDDIPPDYFCQQLFEELSSKKNKDFIMWAFKIAIDIGLRKTITWIPDDVNFRKVAKVIWGIHPGTIMDAPWRHETWWEAFIYLREIVTQVTHIPLYVSGDASQGFTVRFTKHGDEIWKTFPTREQALWNGIQEGARISRERWEEFTFPRNCILIPKASDCYEYRNGHTAEDCVAKASHIGLFVQQDDSKKYRFETCYDHAGNDRGKIDGSLTYELNDYSHRWNKKRRAEKGLP